MQQPQQLQASYYGKGIAVYGPTQNWKEDLKALNGKYNPNLGGQPGWIFGKSHETALMQFIANANAGVIQPTPSQTPQRSPYRQQQPQQMGYTPQPILNGPQPMITVQPFQQQLPVIQPLVRPALVVQPQAQQQQPQQPSLIASNMQQIGRAGVAPLRFTDANGQDYELQWYAVPVPRIGQHLEITYDQSVDAPAVTYTVTNLNTTNPTTSFAAVVDQTGEQVIFDLVRGEWQGRDLATTSVKLVPDTVIATQAQEQPQ